MRGEDEKKQILKRKLEELLHRKAILNEPMPPENVSKVSENLVQLYQVFLTSHDFKPGDLVTWKSGLKNKMKPRINEPAIVIEVLESPVYDADKDSGSPYFREPLDMIIGVLEEDDGVMLFFHVDHRRLQPFEQ